MTSGGLPLPGRGGQPVEHRQQSTNLADILKQVRDKGIVIAGDIRVNLLEIELLTIEIRLLIASVDKPARSTATGASTTPACAHTSRTWPRRTDGCESGSARWKAGSGRTRPQQGDHRGGPAAATSPFTPARPSTPSPADQPATGCVDRSGQGS